MDERRRRGTPRPGNGGQRPGAGRPPTNIKLGPVAARQLHSLARQQDRPAATIAEELINKAYKEATMQTASGVEIVHGAQVMLRGLIPMVLIGRPLVDGLWRPGPGITGTMLWMTAGQIVKATNATLDKHARYPLLREKDMEILRSGRTFAEWEVGWWIEPNLDPATHIDHESLSNSAHDIYSNS